MSPEGILTDVMFERTEPIDRQHLNRNCICLWVYVLYEITPNNERKTQALLQYAQEFFHPDKF